MQHALVMAVLEALDKLLHEPFDLVRVKVDPWVTDQPSKVVIEVPVKTTNQPRWSER